MAPRASEAGVRDAASARLSPRDVGFPFVVPPGIDREITNVTFRGSASRAISVAAFALFREDGVVPGAQIDGFVGEERGLAARQDRRGPLWRRVAPSRRAQTLSAARKQ